MTVGLVLWWFLLIIKITWARSWTTSPPTATSSKIDVNHGENHRSRYSTNIEFLAILKLAPQMIECLVHQQSSRHPCIHWLSSSGSLLLPLTCHYYQSNVMKGLKRDAEGLWLVKTEHRAAGKNPDGNDCALVLPLPSLSLAHVVVVVLSVPGPSSTPLSPAFLHLHAIASQPPF